MASSNASVIGNEKQKVDDPMKQTMLIIEHKIRNLEKRKVKLEGYLQQQRNGPQLLTDEQLSAASKYNEVISNLEFAKNLKNQLNSLVVTKLKKKHVDDKEKVPVPVTVDSKIKEVLIFQNILERIKNESVQQDLLTGYNGAVLTDIEIANLSHFSKMVSPKCKIENGKPLKSIEDQLKTVAKHYSKLVDSKPNVVAGTSYANLKECLLKIEKSGYLNYIMKNAVKETKSINEENKSELNVCDIVHQSIDHSSDFTSDNVQISGIPNVQDIENNIETIYFTNNTIAAVTEDKTEKNNSVFNTTFDFLQDSQLEEDHTSVNPNTVPTKIFSSMYSAPMEDKILKVHPTSSQNRTMDFNTFKGENVNHLSTENWAMGQTGVSTNSNWIQGGHNEVNKHIGHEKSSNFSIMNNGYTEDLNELLQKSLVFNKQESFPANPNNNSTFYQNNFEKNSSKSSTEYYGNPNINYDRSQSNKFNKTTNMGDGSTASHGFHQGNVYNNKNDFYQISRQT